MEKKMRRLEISRRIGASAEFIFEILASPSRHMDFDGSGMLRGAVHEGLITKVGDSFTIKMQRLGDDYLMINHVVEFEPDRRIFGNLHLEISLGQKEMIHPKSSERLKAIPPSLINSLELVVKTHEQEKAI